MKRFLIIIPIGVLAFSLNYLPGFNKVGEDSDYTVCTFSTDDKKCSFCHNDKIKHDVLHGNVAEDCESCHESTGNKHPRASLKGFNLAAQPPELCYVCHEQKNIKSHIHAPVEVGECNSCHAVHGSKYQYLLSKDPISNVCNECHDIDLSENVKIHAALELDGCKTCHNSHQSDYDFLLTDEKSNLCFVCHDTESELMKSQYKHAPFEDDCANCHNPHSSKHDHLLSTSSDELCFTCHDDLAQSIKDSKYVHKVAENGKHCQNCHSPHASSNPKMLAEKQEKLCFSCHNKEITSGSKTISNIEQKLKESKFKHSALEMGGCELCHNPHASDHVSLLNGAFPDGEYAPANSSSFELCFTCHDIEMTEKEVTETATNFRKGDQNLHYVHIKGEKGRNCNICHDMHAADNKLLIKRRTTFGSWDMPMNFKQTSTGASCRTGCHKEEKYDRVKAVININIVNNESDLTNENISNTDTTNIVTDITDNNIIKEDTVKVVDTDENIIIEDTTKVVTNDPDNTIIKEDSTKVVALDPDHITVNEDTTKTVSDDPVNTIIKEDTTKVVTDDPNNNIIKEDTSNVVTRDPDNSTKISAQEAFNKIMPMTILFSYAKDVLVSEIDNELNKIAGFMKGYPEIVIEIGGHTDYIGSLAYNIDLSRKRAQAIKRILISKGILPQRIEIKAYGESFPIDTNSTEKGRKNNRRVEFKISK